MDSSQSSPVPGGGVVWYNFNPSDSGVITQSGTVNNSVQLEVGGDLARQLNQQQVQIQYGSIQTIQLPNGQTQQVFLAHSPSTPQTIIQQTQIEEEKDEPDTTSATIIQEVKQIPSPPAPKQLLAPDRTSSHTIKHTVTEPVAISLPRPRQRGAYGPERVPCPQCGKTFSCNANLRDHLRLHTGEKPFTCTECGLAFTQRSNWRLHKRVHTGERPYMCGICGKTFSRSSHLPGHMRVHTGERPFRCTHCVNSFSTAQALKNHARTHTGERPFICDFCETPFTHSSSLSSHKKRCTGEKRKRGRPLGSGRRSTKKKLITRPRGRPKKKLNKKGGGRKKKVKPTEDVAKLAGDEIIRDESILSRDQIIIDTNLSLNLSNTKLPTPVEVGIKSEMHVNFVDVNCKEMTILESDVLEESEDEMFTNTVECRTLGVTADMIQAGAAAAEINSNCIIKNNDPSDLHQEAAVTMASLQQHGVLNLAHTSVTDQHLQIIPAHVQKNSSML